MAACGSEGVVKEEEADEQPCHVRVNVKGVVGLHRSLGDRSNRSRCFVCLVVVGSEGGMAAGTDMQGHNNNMRLRHLFSFVIVRVVWWGLPQGHAETCACIILFVLS